MLLTLRCNDWPRCMIEESGAEEILSLEGDKEEEMQEGGEQKRSGDEEQSFPPLVCSHPDP